MKTRSERFEIAVERVVRDTFFGRFLCVGIRIENDDTYSVSVYGRDADGELLASRSRVLPLAIKACASDTSGALVLLFGYHAHAALRSFVDFRRARERRTRPWGSVP